MQRETWVRQAQTCVLTALSFLALPPLAALAPIGWMTSVALAQAPSEAEKQAFAAAKELGTLEAWEAFLNNYPSGFHADLARAYVKKLGVTAPTQAPAASTPSAANIELASEEPCSMQRKLKSYQSTDPVKLRFINKSGAVRIIQWIDFNGALKEFYTLQPGEERVQDTFLTHPWIAAWEEGSCAQLFMPGQPESIALLSPNPTVSPSTTTSPKKTDKQPSKAKVERRAKAACEDIGMIYLNGKCAPKKKAERQKAKANKNKACPAGMYRNPYGQCQPNETGG